MGGDCVRSVVGPHRNGVYPIDSGSCLCRSESSAGATRQDNAAAAGLLSMRYLFAREDCPFPEKFLITKLTSNWQEKNTAWCTAFENKSPVMRWNYSDFNQYIWNRLIFTLACCLCSGTLHPYVTKWWRLASSHSKRVYFQFVLTMALSSPILILD